MNYTMMFKHDEGTLCEEGNLCIRAWDRRGFSVSGDHEHRIWAVHTWHVEEGVNGHWEYVRQEFPNQKGCIQSEVVRVEPHEVRP